MNEQSIQVRLGEYPFLIELMKKGEVYSGYPATHIVEVVAAKGVVEDWAAYVQRPTQMGSTRSYGAKLTKEAGERLFPQWAEIYKWRD